MPPAIPRLVKDLDSFIVALLTESDTCKRLVDFRVGRINLESFLQVGLALLLGFWLHATVVKRRKSVHQVGPK